MKRVYESPVLYVEEFMANHAIAACNTEHITEYTFDCMYGNQTDISNSIIATNIDTTSPCTNNVGYAPDSTTAINYEKGFGHTSNTGNISAKWTTTDEYVQVVYAGDFDGLLYADSNGRNSTPTLKYWTVLNNVVTRKAGKDGKHIMVAPLVDATTASSSW